MRTKKCTAVKKNVAISGVHEINLRKKKGDKAQAENYMKQSDSSSVSIRIRMALFCEIKFKKVEFICI